MTVPEFIYINEHAVRVTSWRHDGATGSIDVVVIARGEHDRDLLLDSFAREPVMIRVGTGSAIPMEVKALETTSTGTGSRSVHRIQASLAPEGTSPREREGTPAGTPAGDRLDRIIELLTEIRDELRKLKEQEWPG